MQPVYQKERRLGLDRRFEIRLDDQRRAGAERRREFRGNLTRLLDSSVLNGEHLQPATLVNVSIGGAGFRAAYNPRVEPVREGKTIHFDVMTPFGTASRSGRVQWTAQSGEYCYWGVQFTGHREESPDGIDELIEMVSARAG